MNDDYRDFLASLVGADVRFLIVGAHAMAVHGYPRSTVDIDIWVEPTAGNAKRLWEALTTFGAPLDDLSIREEDFTAPDIVAQFGLPPNRIDVLTGVSGLQFDRAWTNRLDATVEGIRVPVLGLADLIENKRVTGRDKDRADIRGLEGTE